MPEAGGGGPVLLACSHGTRSLAGQHAISALVEAVARAHPEVEVRQAFVDVQDPDVSTALADLAGRSVRVVPLLLSTGFHVRVDLIGAGIAAGAAVAATLGPDPALVEILAERLLARLGQVGSEDTVLLGAAGSSDPDAIAGCDEMARGLADRLGHPVRAAYLSAAEPRVADAVTDARARGAARVAVAGYLLAPGHFSRLLDGCGADIVTAPLLEPDVVPDRRLVDLVVRRYRGN